MTDFKGNELNVGDKVIFTYKSAGNLLEGIISRVRKSDIIVDYDYKDWKDVVRTCKAEVRSPSLQVFKLV